ncbi:hypothetical protein RB653_011166 (mitochondrion) [Dictyostelium firmibasis]|uniref:Uncharacterized protein n=1 Tax=Dictyostelium firmibasis TaxID=79012 RepID=A0AAN7YT30_9MYCE
MKKTPNKKGYKYEKKLKEIQECFSSTGPIFIGQLMSLSGAEYNMLRKYAIEHKIKLIHINANQVKNVFSNVNEIILNNTMVLIKAPTMEVFNKVIEYVKNYEAQILPLEMLINEEESYRVVREQQYLEYKKEMEKVGTTKEAGLVGLTKMLQVNTGMRAVKLIKILNDYNKPNKG